MIMLTSYCDVAGTESDYGYLIGVALISNEEKWLRYEREWEKALRKHPRIPGIHMTDYMRSNPSPPYDGLADDERDLLESKLINVAKRGIRYLVIVGLPLSDYREVNELYCLEEQVGSPYNYLAWTLFQRAADWIEGMHTGAQMRFCFERGDRGQGKFRHFIDTNDIQGIHFEWKRDPVTGKWFRPLEAADMIGWVVRRSANRVPCPRNIAEKVKLNFPVQNEKGKTHRVV